MQSGCRYYYLQSLLFYDELGVFVYNINCIHQYFRIILLLSSYYVLHHFCFFFINNNENFNTDNYNTIVKNNININNRNYNFNNESNNVSIHNNYSKNINIIAIDTIRITITSKTKLSILYISKPVLYPYLSLVSLLFVNM